MMSKQVNPEVTLKSFSCPNCHAMAAQCWFVALVDFTSNGNPPLVWTTAKVASLKLEMKSETVREIRDQLAAELPHLERLSQRRPFIRHQESGTYSKHSLLNIFVSQCFSCDELAIWKHDTLIYPSVRHGVHPNSDLWQEIQDDFNEARDVFEASPRAAAALLRLCVQKLCKQLGEPGENINTDIGSLVSKGLPQTIQKALDLVRVVGNNAVHPGILDLNDDRGTAAKLFELVNLIADNQISQPAAVARLFDEKLTQGAKDQIAKRDSKRT